MRLWGARATAAVLAAIVLALAYVLIAVTPGSASAHAAYQARAQASAHAAAVAKPAPKGKRTHAKGVRYTSRTVVVPSKLVRQQLKRVSKNGATYTFKSAKGPLRKLKSGKVMFLKAVAVRDVTKVKRHHRQLIVTTKPAELTDLIANGTLSWSRTPVKFSKGYALGGSAVPMLARSARDTGPVPAAPKFGMRAVSSHGVTIKGSTHSYDFATTFKSAGKAVSVAITISKSSPVDVSATIKGKLNNLNSTGAIKVTHGHLKQASFQAGGLTGQFTLSYSIKPLSAFGLGKAGGILVTLPAELTVPFAVGGIPFFVGIKTSIFASVGFSGFDQAVTGSYTIKYNGNGGFSTSSSGVTSAKGLVKGIGQTVLNAANAVNKGPLTVIFGAQVPKLELGLGVKGLNVAGSVTLIADTGVATFGSGCDTRGLLVQGSTGAEASFFGFSVPLGSKTLFSKQYSSSYPAGCGTFPGF